MLKLLLLLLLLLNLPIIELSSIDLVVAILLLLQLLLLLRQSGLILDSLPAVNVFFGLEWRRLGQGLQTRVDLLLFVELRIRGCSLL